MNEFFKAIYSHGVSASDFKTAISSRFSYGEAPQEEDQTPYPEKNYCPYAVFFGLPSVNEDTFSETLDDLSFQINIYSDSKSSIEVGEILKKCKDHFDGTTLTVTGFSDVTIKREMQTPPWKDGDKWCASIEFNVLLEEI